MRSNAMEELHPAAAGCSAEAPDSRFAPHEVEVLLHVPALRPYLLVRNA